MTTTTPNTELFNDVEDVIIDDLRFKAKLAIGENAYATLSVKNRLGDIWDTVGFGATAVGAAQSTVVASTFFAPTGLMAALGFGTAVTPIGWVVAAGLVGAGAYHGVTRLMKQHSDGLVIEVPLFINSPIDVLAVAIFDILAPLAMKVAAIDGEITPDERQCIQHYFVKEWGYDARFVEQGLKYTETELSEFTIKSLAHDLATMQHESKDCNFDAVSKDIIAFLHEIMEVDGHIDEREEMAIERVQAVFKQAEKNILQQTIHNTTETASAIGNGVAHIAGQAGLCLQGLWRGKKTED